MRGGSAQCYRRYMNVLRIYHMYEYIARVFVVVSSLAPENVETSGGGSPVAHTGLKPSRDREPSSLAPCA